MHTLPVTLNNVRVEEKAGYLYDIEVVPQFVQIRTQITDPKALPDGLSTEALTFPASTEIQEREVGLTPIEGITAVGSPKVRVRLVPRKKPSTSNAGTGAKAEEVST